jgi:hypothetical protein
MLPCHRLPDHRMLPLACNTARGGGGGALLSFCAHFAGATCPRCWRLAYRVMVNLYANFRAPFLYFKIAGLKEIVYNLKAKIPI